MSLVRTFIFALLLGTVTEASADILGILGGISQVLVSETSKQKNEQARKQQEEAMQAEHARREEDQKAADLRWEEKLKAEEEQRAAAQLAADKAREERNQSLLARKVAPESIEDLDVLYDYPEDGWALADSPKFKADKEVYIISGEIESKVADLWICRTEPDTEKLIGDYFALRIGAKTKKPADFRDRIRVKGRIFSVGKYMGNRDYLTIGGQKKIMPIFDSFHVVLPED